MKNYVDYIKKTLLIYERDNKLLHSLFEENLSQNQFLTFFENVDFFKERQDYIYLLAYLGEKYKYKDVDLYKATRLKRLARLRQYHNLSLLYHFKKLATELNKNNIPILLLKGAAIKFSYPEASFRNMDDIDLAVPPELFESAIKIAQEIGFKKSFIAEHSIDFKYDDFGIDIHKRIFRSNYSHPHNEKAMFERAKKCDIFGISIYLPSEIDLALILISNVYYNLIDLPCNTRIIQWLYDFAYILKKTPHFDWDLFIESAYNVELSRQTIIMLDIFNDYFPELLPDQIFSKLQFQEHDEQCLISDIKYIKSNLLRLKILNNTNTYKKTLLNIFKKPTNLFVFIYNRIEYLVLAFINIEPLRVFVLELMTEKWIQNELKKYRLHA